MATDRKMEPKLAEAAAKTTAALETLRSRLNREATAQETPVKESTEAPDELDRELKQYFAGETFAPPPREQPKPATGSREVRAASDIRGQVIDGVVDRILRSWSAPDGDIPASIKSEVIARLVEHILAELLNKSDNPR